METGPIARSINTGAAGVGALETVVDIAAHAVAVGNGVGPVVGVVVAPIAKGIDDRAAGIVQSLAHNVIAVEAELGSPGLPLIVAVIILKVIHTPRGEDVGVLLLVAQAAGIFAAGEDACRAIHSILHAQVVDAVGNSLHAVGKLLGVVDEVAGVIAAGRPAIIEHDVVITQVAQAVVNHGLSGVEQELLGDVAMEGIPVVPAHLRHQVQAVVGGGTGDDNILGVGGGQKREEGGGQRLRGHGDGSAANGSGVRTEG